jgi:hypothetical protein
MEREAISSQISKILHSESFADKDQLQRLLAILFTYIDAPTSLKPDRVIRELWPEEVKTKRPADVATEMNRLRRVLKAYYETEGQTDSILVALPNRSAATPDGTKERRWIFVEPRMSEATDPATSTSLLSSVHSELPIRPGVPVPEPSSAPRVKSRRGLIAAAVLVAFSVGVYVAVRALTADNRPQSGRIDNSELVIMNAEGKELWRKTLPGGFWSKYYEDGLATHLYFQDGLNTHLWFGDLAGDGHTDVLLLYHPAMDPKSHSTTLICYSDTGKEKWRWTPGRILPELNPVPSVYIAMGFGVLPATHNEGRRIVVMSRHEYYYPTQIAIVDANGKTLSEYWHSGHLFHFNLTSIEGREEILASGISNGYHQATLVVLDPEKVFGASAEPVRPEVQLHGMGAPHERFRLLFPRSDLNKDLYLYNEAQGAVLSPGRVQIDVKECWLTVPQGCTIVYGFDDNFNLLSASAEDTFLEAHRDYYSKNKVNHSYSAREEEAFQQVTCLAGCKTEFISVQIP